MGATERTIRFTLNGRPVTATVESHLDLVDLLQRFDLTGAREAAVKACVAVARCSSTASRFRAVSRSRSSSTANR
jgi:aerobic-type carbon monoxide dehydrogenase small subunit (CoxS/CutS family)